MKHGGKLEQIFLTYWWVFLFVLFCYTLYEDKMRSVSLEHLALLGKYEELKSAKMHAMLEQERLLMQLHSREDKKFIEMTLMKRLGLVPKGQTKVFFTPLEILVPNLNAPYMR